MKTNNVLCKQRWRKIVSGGHVMSKNMANDLISADSVAPNRTLNYDM